MDPYSPERRPTAGDATPAVVAIVVSYNSSRDLPSCLAALEAQRGVDLEIHVVDNASTDGSADVVRRQFPRAQLTVNERNVGFGRASNQLLTSREAPFYALVNPDAVPDPGAIRACVDYLRTDPKAALAGTRLVRPGGTLQPSCHAFLDLANLLGETLGLHRIAPGLRPFTSLYMPSFPHDRIAEVDWIDGAFLVARREAVRTVGAFDPEFFMYGEEMDWCRRLRGADWKVVFLPEPAVVHVGGAASRPVAGSMFVENLKGRVRFLRKHRGTWTALAARGLIAASVLLRLAWREGQALAARLIGRAVGETLQLKLEMFRAASRWVLQGMSVEHGPSEAEPQTALSRPASPR